jgi:Secretion system C-terminal sorting domain
MKHGRNFGLTEVLILIAATIMYTTNNSYSQQMVPILDQGKASLPDPIVSLSIGNKFVFDGWWHIDGGLGEGRFLFTEEITGDSLVNNLTYAVVRRHPSFASLRIPTNSIDSRNDTIILRRCEGHKFYEYRPPLDSELLLVDFDDSTGVEYPHYGPITSRQFEPILNDTALIIKVFVYYKETLLNRVYASRFGFEGYHATAGVMNANTDLIGAVIDNVVYGDTSRFDSIQTGIRRLPEIPATYRLHQNFPNPFNPSTKIRYDISQRGRVTVKIFDMLGREAASLVDNMNDAGSYEVEWDASRFASGVYFCVIRSGWFTETRKMMLLK